ncbi:MAG: type II toxin-antitoxin system PemK/MazF family toxin [Cyanobacteria bacterium P01_A01_bin.40]
MSGIKNFCPRRGIIADFNLDPTKSSETGKIRPCIVVSNDIYNQKLSVIQIVPITQWSAKKGRIITNVLLNPTTANGLLKKSIADCLQTRPIDYSERYIRQRGQISEQVLLKIDEALKIIFGLD